MTESDGDIHIDPEGVDAVMQFGSNEQPLFDISQIIGASGGASALPAPTHSIPEGNVFRKTAATTIEENDKFVTDVRQGIDAFVKGARKMTEAYNAADQQMTKTMSEVTTRDAGEPEVLDALTKPTS